MRKIKLPTMARSTTPGYENENGQIVLSNTGFPSESRAGQRIYKLRCKTCHFEYGVPGIDIDKRLCPAHQAGAPGEPLREQGPGLFG